MTTDEHYAFLLMFFRATGFGGEGHELFDGWFWRTDGEYAPLTIWANCNDTFDWGSSDLEKLTPENIHILEGACKDAEAATPAGAVCYGQDLFCARVRKMRPQGACYSGMPEAVAGLFNECGPEREVWLGNPYPNDINRKR